MIIAAILAYVHFITLAILVTVLAVEWLLLHPIMPTSHARLIKQADLWYGISAGIMALSGIGRVFAEKGSDYYLHNPIFWTKIALFAVVGGFSVPPTLRYLRWKPETSGDFVIDHTEHQSIKRLILWQFILLALIPLCAVLMARGFGA